MPSQKLITVTRRKRQRGSVLHGGGQPGRRHLRQGESLKPEFDHGIW